MDEKPFHTGILKIWKGLTQQASKTLKAIDPSRSKGERLTAETQMLREKKRKIQMAPKLGSLLNIKYYYF